ncbi:hypothetical protein DESME_11720 [Desulfitobacterium metallireducens DSM 15288]|uniref:Uncharacterized protein n=1 Tax=Desulfitobacterium metallireducens DSM 15288 TaxID=871968 RepID=W0ED09_9FIRM|nr:hypothetical protein DESME_11720 [Desulfitobacterium metallireducens DSM 15288]
MEKVIEIVYFAKICQNRQEYYENKLNVRRNVIKSKNKFPYIRLDIIRLMSIMRTVYEI